MAKTDRLNKQIQRLAAEIILYQMSDPRINFVTVTHARLTEDFRYCTVYVSIFGSETEQRTTMRGLEHARRFIQRQLGDRLHLRRTPILRIEQDVSIAKSIEVCKKIDEAVREDEAAHAGEETTLADKMTLDAKKEKSENAAKDNDAPADSLDDGDDYEEDDDYEDDMEDTDLDHKDDGADDSDNPGAEKGENDE
jgi:ribosome-binding factor A